MAGQTDIFEVDHTGRKATKLGISADNEIVVEILKGAPKPEPPKDEPEEEKYVAQVTEIQVHASTRFNHPHERFANFKPGVTLKAVVTQGANTWEEARKLQTLAESLVQAEKAATLERLGEQRKAAGVQQDVFEKTVRNVFREYVDDLRRDQKRRDLALKTVARAAAEEKRAAHHAARKGGRK